MLSRNLKFAFDFVSKEKQVEEIWWKLQDERKSIRIYLYPESSGVYFSCLNTNKRRRWFRISTNSIEAPGKVVGGWMWNSQDDAGKTTLKIFLHKILCLILDMAKRKQANSRWRRWDSDLKGMKSRREGERGAVEERREISIFAFSTFSSYYLASGKTFYLLLLLRRRKSKWMHKIVGKETETENMLLSYYCRVSCSMMLIYGTNRMKATRKA